MIEINIDTRHLDQTLSRLSHAVADMTPAMTAIGEKVASLIDNTFVNQATPYGNSWAELSDVTKAKRRKGPRPGNDKILNDSGILKNSIVPNPSRTQVEIGTNEKYGKTHQFGASQGQYGRTRRNTPIPWGNVPARPFMPTEAGGLPNSWEQDITDIITRHINSAF
jgi:phage virion morphogenesis protein